MTLASNYKPHRISFRACVKPASRAEAGGQPIIHRSPAGFDLLVGEQRPNVPSWVPQTCRNLAASAVQQLQVILETQQQARAVAAKFHQTFRFLGACHRALTVAAAEPDVGLRLQQVHKAWAVLDVCSVVRATGLEAMCQGPLLVARLDLNVGLHRQHPGRAVAAREADGVQALPRLLAGAARALEVALPGERDGADEVAVAEEGGLLQALASLSDLLRLLNMVNGFIIHPQP
mmetsp:Transcript_37274/g.93573  ORF Transcript_37274/g.93573 Transcript_37274/m.93573 type:complete len:233 (+) Transcript_37274:45-743(+)